MFRPATAASARRQWVAADRVAHGCGPRGHGPLNAADVLVGKL